jgi:hypothetical protein
MMILFSLTPMGRSQIPAPTPDVVCYWNNSFSLPIDRSPFTHRNW